MYLLTTFQFILLLFAGALIGAGIVLLLKDNNV